MLLSMALVLLFGLLGNLLFKAFRLPGLLGMLLVGMVLGPYMLDWLDTELLAISHELRLFALVVILLRAGFGVNRRRLLANGKTSVLLAFIPSVLEALSIIVLAMWFFDFSFVQGGLLGFIIAAVSPAVVVPAMLGLIEKKKGRDKAIPTMILAAAALDDVIAISFFSMFVGLYFGTRMNVGMQLISMPLSIFFGIAAGAVSGSVLVWIFKKFHLRDSKKVLIIFALSFFFLAIEHALEDVVMFAAFIGIMTIGLVITALYPALGARLSSKLNKIWVFAEILLFVLIGAAVDIHLAFTIGFVGLFMLLIGLVVRSFGVILSTVGNGYSVKERLFIVFAYWPKATVQAAIGAIPLSLGVAGGEIILALSVLSILVSAPLGAILIDRFSSFLVSAPPVSEKRI